MWKPKKRTEGGKKRCFKKKPPTLLSSAHAGRVFQSAHRGAEVSHSSPGSLSFKKQKTKNPTHFKLARNTDLRTMKIKAKTEKYNRVFRYAES